MREIKFRVWADVLNKAKRATHKMIYFGEPDYTYMDFEDNLECRSLNALQGNCNDHIWMQYTGLKDKNGKEIYEGDIVTCYTGWNSDSSSITKFKSLITFEQGMFGVKMEQHGNQMLKLTGFNYIEILGNIYENPELLEKKNET